MIRLVNAAGSERILPATIIFNRIPFDLHVPFKQLIGKDGAVVTGRGTLQPRLFQLEGRLYYGGDKEKVRQEADRLLAFLMEAPIEVHQGGRFLIAYPQGMPQHWVDEGVELDLQIPMLAADPFFYGAKVELDLQGSQYLEVSGNAPAIPFIKTGSSVQNLTVTNQRTGQEIIVSGASGAIEIDNLNHRVKVGGIDRLDLVNETWLVSGFFLFPGENFLSTSSKIVLGFHPRWL